MDKNIYPESITIEKNMIPIIRISLIKRIDELRESCKDCIDRNYFQSAIENINELSFIVGFIKDLDQKIEFDRSDEPYFELEF